MQVVPAQQPLEQVLGSHDAVSHRPASQKAVPVHTPHAVPPEPQAPFVSPVRHAPFSQQPDGQVAGPQGGAAQLPASQKVPVPHAWQVLPARPQSTSLVEVTQVAPWQHPGQVAGSQEQPPSTQASPALHAAPAPQVHPPAVQPSACVGGQKTQALPLSPHPAKEGGERQPGPEQHPLAQFAAVQPLQTPASEQVCGEGQAWHRLPPEPQALASAPATQVSPEQHPAGQEAGVQRQDPKTHCWPGPHAGPVPQLQTPPRHRSLFDDGQAMQVWPAAPQVVKVETWQTSPAQQPEAHELAVQWQAPIMHW